MTESVCVFCRAHPVDPKWRPFCSERCKLQDLAKWADGSYGVPAESEHLKENSENQEDYDS
jgi:endogenous inhibitor of DNA gyrase (YacG/DUF329 family)